MLLLPPSVPQRGDRVKCLQEHVEPQREMLTRVAFDRLARESGCQLQCPFPGEEVVVFRSGLVQHLRRYMQVSSCS